MEERVQRLRAADDPRIALREPTLAKALRDAVERGLTEPAGCFIAIDSDGGIEGLIAFSEVDSQGRAYVELLHAAWHDEPTRIVRELLDASLSQLPVRPATLEYLLDEPHPWHLQPAKRRAALADLGFEIARSTRRWEWRAGAPIPAGRGTLSYSTVEHGGRAAFEHAISRVSEDSLDRRLAADRKRLGPVEDSRRHADFLLGLDHDPRGYELAYDTGGELVGLLAAARGSSWPIVALIGVVPERRGRGHGLTLLARATRHLARADGTTSIRADSDELNEPMRRCFERAGYTQFATRSEYRRAGI